ncbi:hypothetical protein U1Q18_039679 [Sarracenia purpurea var. burkii]
MGFCGCVVSGSMKRRASRHCGGALVEAATRRLALVASLSRARWLVLGKEARASRNPKPRWQRRSLWKQMATEWWPVAWRGAVASVVQNPSPNASSPLPASKESSSPAASAQSFGSKSAD